jgi:hypothetical protein
MSSRFRPVLRPAPAFFFFDRWGVVVVSVVVELVFRVTSDDFLDNDGSFLTLALAVPVLATFEPSFFSFFTLLAPFRVLLLDFVEDLFFFEMDERDESRDEFESEEDEDDDEDESDDREERAPLADDRDEDRDDELEPEPAPSPDDDEDEEALESENDFVSDLMSFDPVLLIVSSLVVVASFIDVTELRCCCCC